MADELHAHLTRNLPALHLPHDTSTQVVGDEGAHLRGFTGRCPAVVKVLRLDRLAVAVVKHERRRWRRAPFARLEDGAEPRRDREGAANGTAASGNRRTLHGKVQATR